MKYAKDVMTSKIVSISHEETIAKVVSKMDEYDVKEVPVLDDNKNFIGEITYYDILDSPRLDSDAGVHTLIVKPPTATPDSTLNEIATLIVDSGIEAIPILKNNKIIGIVSDYDILKELSNDERIKKLTANDIMRIPSKFLRGDEPIATARRLMRFYNTDRLPVINDNGKSLGLVLSMDILRAFYKRPTERKGTGDRSGGIDNPLLIPVKNFMRTDIPDISINDNVPSIIKKMLEKNLRGLQVLDEDGKTVGIINRLDILDRLVEKKFHDGVWVNFTGEHLPYDTVEAVKEYITTDVKKLKSFLPALVSVDIHVRKMHAATPNKWNYELNVSLVKSAGKNETVRTMYGFNLMFTVKEALEKLIKQLESKYKERQGKPY